MDMRPSDSSHHVIVENSPCRIPKSRNEEAGKLGPSWYFSRKEIEENSPSKKDGIDVKKESYLRKSYCTFLQDLGIRLRVPQATIATSIVFCHRFYLRQSHARNDRRFSLNKINMDYISMVGQRGDSSVLETSYFGYDVNYCKLCLSISFEYLDEHMKMTIATVCMFLAGKVEETPRPLKDVIMVSYEIIHKKDPAAGQKIKQREIYDKQKELILLGERVVLGTLGFDLNVHHPYKPLVEAIKKYKIVHNALAQVAWNFINDGLRTSLCLQFKPHHIAAGALVLASKFLKVKFLPDDGEKAWYQDFDVTPRQLEEVSNQMLELYEQNRAVQSRPLPGNEAEGSSASAANQRISVKTRGNSEESSAQGHHQASKQSDSNHSTSAGVPIPEHSKPDTQIGNQKILHSDNGDDGSNKTSGLSGGRVDAATEDCFHHDTKMPGSSMSSYKSDILTEEQKPLPSHGSSSGNRDGILNNIDGPSVSSSMMDAMHKIDKDKVKAALEKRRKLKVDFARKVDVMDDDDLLESELEHGVELAAVKDEKIKQEKSHASLHQEDHKSADEIAENGHHGEQSVPETAKDTEFLMDVQEQHSPESTKRNDVCEQSDPAPEHSEGHNDTQLVVRHDPVEEDHKMPQAEG